MCMLIKHVTVANLYICNGRLNIFFPYLYKDGVQKDLSYF